jgi:hypothetical protein
MATWSLIGKKNIVAGDFVWPFVSPQINADSCWIKVKVMDLSRNIGIDTCDSPFRIISATDATKRKSKLPSELAFSTLYFGTNAVFTVNLPQAGKINIEVFNVHGKLLWNYRSTVKKPGRYRVKWETVNALNSGVWFAKLMTETENIIKKVTLVR